MVESFLRSLVTALDGAWRSRGWSQTEFPALAAELLASACTGLDGDALLRYAAQSRPEPRGRHAAAEVVPLWSGARFEVHAHVWLETIAPPHDHGWAGAFTLVEGRAVNGRHRFEVHERPCPGLALGELERSGLELLEAGDTVAVTPGPAFIHSVLHLERPGVAISVRSKRRSRKSTTYFHPGLALEDEAADDELRGRLRALTLMRGIDEERFVELLEELVRDGDRLASFLALSDAVQAGWSLNPAIVAAGEATHGDGFSAIVGALDELLAYQTIVELRAEHHEPRMRAFLAGLYSCSGRRELLATLAELGVLDEPGRDPWQQIGAWLVELLVDADEAELPAFLPRALGQLAAGRTGEQLRASEGDRVHDHHLEFLEDVRGLLVSSPLYRCLTQA